MGEKVWSALAVATLLLTTTMPLAGAGPADPTLSARAPAWAGAGKPLVASGALTLGGVGVPFASVEVWLDGAPKVSTLTNATGGWAATLHLPATLGDSIVQARWSAGPLRAESAPVVVHRVGRPSEPHGLVAVALAPSATVQLAWSAPNATDGAPVEGYDLSRQVNGGAWSLFASVGGGATSATDATAPRASIVAYRVVARTGGGASDPSATASATTPPAAPTGIAATAVPGARAVDVTWGAPAASAAPPTQYVVFRDGVELARVDASARSFRDATPAWSTRYAYGVSAMNAGGEGPRTSAWATSVPAAPASLAGESDATTPRVNLTWSAPTDGDLSRITAYRVERRAVAGEWQGIAQVGPAVRVYNDTAPGAGSQEYRVVALSAGGAGPPSPSVVLTPAPVTGRVIVETPVARVCPAPFERAPESDGCNDAAMGYVWTMPNGSASVQPRVHVYSRHPNDAPEGNVHVDVELDVVVSTYCTGCGAPVTRFDESLYVITSNTGSARRDPGPYAWEIPDGACHRVDFYVNATRADGGRGSSRSALVLCY